MVLAKCIVFSFFTISYFSKAQHTSDHNDLMSWEDKDKLHGIAREFIYKMQLMQRQLLPLKLKHVNSISYQVGLVIGTMREKYRRMMDIYSESVRKDTGRTRIMGPGIWTMKPMHYMIAMETMRMIEVEIHKYVDLLVKIPEEEFDEMGNMMDQMNQMNQIGQIGGPKKLRSGDYSDVTSGFPTVPRLGSTTKSSTTTQKIAKREGKQLLTEEDIKRQFREQYMRQNGMQRDDWSLDRHYGFI